MDWIKRIGCGVVILLLGGFYCVNYLEERAARKEEEVQREREEETVKASISEMVLRTNAIDDWEDKLVQQDQFRMSNILTIELEKLWQHDKPILFIGSIKDIVTASDTEYLVIIERDLLHHFGRPII